MLEELIGSLVQLLLFALLPLLVWFFTARKKLPFFAWIGLKRPVCARPGETLLLSLLISLLYIGAMSLCMKILPEGVTTAGAQFAGQGAAALPAVFFYAVVRTALSEELLFRGFLLKRLQSRFGFAAGNAVQALLFGLLHGVPFGLVTGSVLSFLLLTLIPGLFGAFQGWLNEKRCGGSLIPSWLLHSAMNLATAILALF